MAIEKSGQRRHIALMARVREANQRSSAPVSEARETGDAMARAFGRATRAAAAAAQAQGLRIPGRLGGRAVEVTPDGEVQPIDEAQPWSPRPEGDDPESKPGS